MSTIERVIPLVGHLPPSIREGLARRVRELSGLGLIALSGVASAALMTWSVQDPSLSHATSRPIRNILGYAGAIGADLAMQILGLGAIMLVLTVAVWGWRMMTHRPFDREALRLGSWILCTVIAAGFASCWPHGGAWPADRPRRRGRRCARTRARGDFRTGGHDLSHGAGHDPVRRDGRDLPDRLRPRRARARRRVRGDRGRRQAA